jgi:hypothetical protein
MVSSGPCNGIAPWSVSFHVTTRFIRVRGVVALLGLGLCAVVSGSFSHVNHLRARATVVAKMEVSTLASALEMYVEDESRYPGEGSQVEPAGNQFPLLFNALFGLFGPSGEGGRSAPYAALRGFKVAVREPGSDRLILATEAQIRDAQIEKLILDPWGDPYIYRVNRGRAPGPAIEMQHPDGADIYSWGPNGVDDTVRGNEDSDDIGNW